MNKQRQTSEHNGQVLITRRAQVNHKTSNSVGKRYFNKTDRIQNQQLPHAHSKSNGDKVNAQLLGPQSELNKGRKTLILDLDETLVHSQFKFSGKEDITLPIEIEGIINYIYVAVRPHVAKFIKEVANIFEVVIFTASLSKYADPLMNKLDPQNYCVKRLFREHCTFHQGSFVKDLSRLGREMKDIIIIDNSPIAYLFQPENSLPCISWYDDINDTNLIELLQILKQLAKVNDVREMLAKFVKNNLVDFKMAKQLFLTLSPIRDIVTTPKRTNRMSQPLSCGSSKKDSLKNSNPDFKTDQLSFKRERLSADMKKPMMNTWTSAAAQDLITQIHKSHTVDETIQNPEQVKVNCDKPPKAQKIVQKSIQSLKRPLSAKKNEAKEQIEWKKITPQIDTIAEAKNSFNFFKSKFEQKLDTPKIYPKSTGYFQKELAKQMKNKIDTKTIDTQRYKTLQEDPQIYKISQPLQPNQRTDSKKRQTERKKPSLVTQNPKGKTQNAHTLKSLIQCSIPQKVHIRTTPGKSNTAISFANQSQLQRSLVSQLSPNQIDKKIGKQVKQPPKIFDSIDNNPRAVKANEEQTICQKQRLPSHSTEHLRSKHNINSPKGSGIVGKTIYYGDQPQGNNSAFMKNLEAQISVIKRKKEVTQKYRPISSQNRQRQHNHSPLGKKQTEGIQVNKENSQKQTYSSNDYASNSIYDRQPMTAAYIPKPLNSRQY